MTFIRVTEAGNYGWPMLLNVADISTVRQVQRDGRDGNALVYLRSIDVYITVVETVSEVEKRINTALAPARTP